jgi:hypothetical protein
MGVDITDPKIKRMTELQTLSQGIVPNAEGLAQLATKLSERGYQTEAAQAYQKSAELRKLEAETTSKTMERMTNEQKNAAAVADASGATRGTPQWAAAFKASLNSLTTKDERTPDEKNFAAAAKGGYTGTFEQFMTSQKRAGATNVSLSSSADKSYGSELGGLVAKDDIAMRNSAQAAPDVLNSIEQTRALLDSGRVYTGTGANVKLNVLALGQALGVTGASENEIITQTQQLQQQRSKAVLNQIKSSGLGTGQGFTDKDLKFLENASAGTITLSADTLKQQLNIEEKLAKASVNKWNARVKTLPAGVTGSMGLAPVELPPIRSNPANQIPTTGGMTGNPLIDKYLVPPTGQ